MKKRVLSIIICLSMLLSALPQMAMAAVDASGTFGDDESWVLDTDGVLTISGNGDLPAWSSYTKVPWYSYRGRVRAIIIEEGITNIPYSTFYKYYTNVSYVSLPETMVYIGDYAFYNCTGIADIEFPKSVKFIGQSTFANCSNLTMFVYKDSYAHQYAKDHGKKFYLLDAEPENPSGECGENVTWELDYESKTLTISGTGKMADYNWASAQPWYDWANQITKVVVEDGITTIGWYAFGELSNLVDVTLPDSVTEIGWYAFTKCTSLKEIEIPEGVKCIENSCFSESGLESITLPEGTHTIENYAFNGATALKEINLPDSITSIGEAAFKNTGYFLDDANWENNILYLGKYLLAAKGSDPLVVKEGTVLIADQAFDDCYYSKSITLPSTLKIIGRYAFYYCGNITSIVIPEGVEYLGGMAFFCCWKLANITLPSTITYIGEDAFEDTVYYSTASNWKDGMLYNGTNLIWSDNSVINANIKEGTTCIAINAFEEDSNLESVTLPKSLKYINEGTFSGKSNLKEVNFSNGLTFIGQNAFGWCYALESVSLPSTIEYIDDYAFNACRVLTKVTFPTTMKGFGTGVFASCEKLKKITLPKGLEVVPEKLLYCCYDLEEIVIPDGTKTLGYEAFAWCSELKKVTIPASVTTFEEYLFNGSSNVTIVGVKGSAAHTYALENGITFEEMPAYQTGDVTGDGRVNTRDIVALRRYVAGGYTVSVIDEMLDITGDGRINTRDIQALRKLVAA